MDVSLHFDSHVLVSCFGSFVVVVSCLVVCLVLFGGGGVAACFARSQTVTRARRANMIVKATLVHMQGRKGERLVHGMKHDMEGHFPLTRWPSNNKI